MFRRSGAAVTALLPVLIVGSACQRDTDARTDTVVDAAEVMLIEPASSTYAVDTGAGAVRAELIIVTDNPTDGPIYLASCGADRPRFALERLSADVWTVAVDTGCPPYITPIAIEPRSTRTDTLFVHATLAGGATAVGEARFAASGVNGTYRIVYEAYRRPWTLSDARPDTGTELPAAERRSGSFEMRTP